jgi:outer membrane lipoprotein-sorting protein
MWKTLAIAAVTGAALVWTPSGRSGGDKDARAIIDKAIQAMGGEKTLKKHQAATFKEKGTYYGMGDGVPYTGEYAMQYPNQFRMEIEGVFIIVINGDKGWMKMGGETKEMEKDQLRNQLKDLKAGWISSLLPLKDKAFSLTALPETEVEKKPALGVKVTRKDWPEVKLYFDKQTGRLVKNEFRSFAQEQGKEVTSEHFMQDHKEMDGAQIPTHIIVKRDGKLFVDAHVVQYKAAGKLDGKVFAMP